MLKKIHASFYFATFIFLFVFGNGFAQTATPLEGCVPHEVAFTAPPGQTSYYWEFGDGTVSTLANPDNIYTTPGDYQVTLRTEPGGTVVGTLTITVYPKPTLSIVSDPSVGCRPLAVNFEGTVDLPSGVNITNYNWSFGDTGGSMGSPNVNYTYQSTGVFTVTFAIETNLESCNVTEIFNDQVTVTSVENVGFITDPFPAKACDPPLDVNFINTTAGANLSYQWDFGNGTTSTEITPPTQTFSDVNNYEVVLTATDENGCTGSVSHPVTIGRAFADFIIRDTVCLGDTLVAENISDPGTYTWILPPSVSRLQPSPEPGKEAFHFSEAGFVELTLEVLPPTDTCIGRVTKLIYVDDPDASFTLDPTYAACPGGLWTVNFNSISPDPVMWFWDFGDGSFSTESDPSHDYLYGDEDAYAEYGDRIYTVLLRVTNASGCWEEQVLTDTISRPDALFLPDSINGCAPLQVMFSDSSRSREPIIRWEYTFGDGSSEVLTDNGDVVHTFTDPGTYEVQLNIENEVGCVDTSYVVLIEVGEQITPNFDVDKTEICPGESVHFTDLTNHPDIDAWNFSTEGDRSFHCYQSDQMDWTYDVEAGPMDVTMTVEINGCYSSITKEDLITVKGPIAHLHYDNDCMDHFGVTFSDSSYEAPVLTWDFGDGSTASGQEERHTYDATGDYTVILTAENPGSGCPASMDTAVVSIRDIRAAFELPDSICRGTTLDLDASNAQDVDTRCWRGYEWLFEISDRPIATEMESIEFTFNTVGEETVTLIVTDENACEDTLQHQLEIFDASANFSAPTQLVCADGNIPYSFTDLSTSPLPIVSWNWDFGDGTTATDQNPDHIFVAPLQDSFLVSLTIENSLGCTSTAALDFYSYQPLTQIITDPFPASLCLGETLGLTAPDFTVTGSHLDFSWDFGNGNGSNTQSTMVDYTETGEYNIVLTYEEVSTGCGGEIELPAYVQEAPDASFTSSVDGQNIICHPAVIEFTNTSTSDTPLNYVWDFGNGQMGTGQNAAAGFEKGTWEISMIASTAFGCRDTAFQTVTLVGPDGDFTFDPPAICRGGEITFTTQNLVDVDNYTWNFGDGTEEMNVSPITHAFDLPTNTTIVTLKMEGEDGACTFVVEKEINIGGVTAGFLINGTDDTAFCENNLVFTNTSEGADAYHWDFGNGQTSIQENPTLTFASGETTIQLIAINSVQGCSDTIVRTIQVDQLPDLEIMDATICAGDSLQLSLTSDFDNGVYTWSPAELLYSTSDKSPQTIALTEPTTFSVTVLDTVIGCDGTVSREIFVIRQLEWMDIDTAICQGEEITTVPLPVNDGVRIFTWSPNPPPFQLPGNVESQEFTLSITDTEGCFDDNYIYSVRVLGTGNIQFPNVFTPNNDGTNDVFRPFFNEAYDDQIEIVDFRVYNRWGQLVFSGDDDNFIWDGTFKGKPAASDVYVFSCEVRLDCGASKIESGEVTLLR